MIDRCVNPTCQAEFRLFNTGNLYALERRRADTEFFWLCPACSGCVALILDASGSVAVQPLSGARHRIPPHPDRDLRLVTHLTGPVFTHRAIAPHDSEAQSFAQLLR
jgi:hypothetical protein